MSYCHKCGNQWHGTAHTCFANKQDWYYTTGSIPYVCTICGAVVPDERRSLHENWHKQ